MGMKTITLVVYCAAGKCLAAATFTVVNTNDAGAGSLRDAITLANFSAGPHTIAFNIPGTNVSSIAPHSPLPVVTNAFFPCLSPAQPLS